MKQALEALEPYAEWTQVSRTGDAPVITYENDAHKAVTSLKQLITQLEKQEPVAWMQVEDGATRLTTTKGGNAGAWEPLYTHPAPAVPDYSRDVEELEYRLRRQAEVHAAEKEALHLQIKMLTDPIVRQKMLEPAPPIFMTAPAVPDAKDYADGLLTMQEQLENNAYVNGWNECREEMLSAAPEYKGEK